MREEIKKKKNNVDKYVDKLIIIINFTKIEIEYYCLKKPS